MAGAYKLFLVMSVVFGSISMSAESYVFLKLPIGITNKSAFNFSVFIRSSSGTILYGTDDRDSILIDIEQEIDHQRISVKFNKFLISESNKNLCGCLTCSDVYVTFVLKLWQHKIVIKCNGRLNVLRIMYPQLSDQFIGLPKVSVYSNKTFFWIGDVPRYLTNQTSQNQPIKNQLSGCLDNFYYHDKFVKVKESGGDFLSSCLVMYNETICNGKYCSMKPKFYKVYDCSKIVSDSAFCKKDLSKYSGDNHSYIINQEINGSIILRLDWIQRFSNNHCLMEILLRDESVMVFYASHQNELILDVSRNQSSNYETKFIRRFTIHQRNTIILDFTDPYVFAKISNGRELWTHILPFTADPIFINIGLYHHRNIFSKYEGAMGFRYDSRRFRQLKKSPDLYNYFRMRSILDGVKMTWIKIGSFIIFVIFICKCYYATDWRAHFNQTLPIPMIHTGNENHTFPNVDGNLQTSTQEDRFPACHGESSRPDLGATINHVIENKYTVLPVSLVGNKRYEVGPMEIVYDKKYEVDPVLIVDNTKCEVNPLTLVDGDRCKVFEPTMDKSRYEVDSLPIVDENMCIVMPLSLYENNACELTSN